MSAAICAREGCDNPVPSRRPGQAGRPPIYCSPACRSSPARSTVVVEIGRGEEYEGSCLGDWMVRLRRGHRVVIVGSGLGRFSATMLVTELRAFFDSGSTSQAS